MTLPNTDATIYDFPKYYDLVYGSDWKAEFDFIFGLWDRFVPFQVSMSDELVSRLGAARCKVLVDQHAGRVTADGADRHGVHLAQKGSVAARSSARC